MADKEIQNLARTIEKNQKDLVTKYNVLVKRTSSIISTLAEMNEKLDYLLETMSMFEIVEEDEYDEDFNPYAAEPEDYYEDDDDDDE